VSFRISKLCVSHVKRVRLGRSVTGYPMLIKFFMLVAGNYQTN